MQNRLIFERELSMMFTAETVWAWREDLEAQGTEELLGLNDIAKEKGAELGDWFFC